MPSGITTWLVGERIVAVTPVEAAIIEPSGAIAARYGERSFSDEDDLWRWRYLVVGDALVEQTVVERRGVPELHATRTIIEGLIPADDPAVQAFAQAALVGDDARAAAATAARKRELEANVAQQIGPLAAPELVRARDALTTRIVRYDDPVARALVPTLGYVARVAADSAAARAFARGCLHACFADATDEDLAGEPIHAPELAAALVAHARALAQAADDQENVDAPNNARAYRRAAQAFQLAARLAGAPGC